ncbi:hypothetical protein BLA29_002243 [Euroglyphus maynei]|uniref:Uncharacterized protein n=1 Tax=Euroglyphus maynei TaxID=6958 RepID=A0A1Y3BQ31_EURMA|nr:hypothetical protein BLA29_002243 [Euroglyphus maynei]
MGYIQTSSYQVEILPPTMMIETPNIDDDQLDGEQSESPNKDKDNELSTPEIIDYRINRLSKEWIEKFVQIS